MSDRRVLISSEMPRFDRDSGSQRIFDTIAFLQEAGWQVTFVSNDPAPDRRYADVLRQRGVAVYEGAADWIPKLVAMVRFDLAIFGWWSFAEPHIETVRKALPAARIIVDSVDVHFLREARSVLSNQRNARKRGVLDTGYASRMMRELNTYARADGVLAVSAKECALIDDLMADSGFCLCVPDNEQLDVSPVPFRERKGILFVGYFKHLPNKGAVEYLCRDVLPLVDPVLLKEHPVMVVGDGIDDKMRAFVKDVEGVRFVGWVPSLAPYLQQARVSVIPLLWGAGTKRKLVQALMSGTPSVSTTIGIEGLELEDGKHVLVADTPARFAELIECLLTDQRVWTKIAGNGRSHIVRRSGRDTAREALLSAVETVMARTPLRPAGRRRRPTEVVEYDRLVDSLRGTVERAVPEGATVMVVSRGDDALLQLGGRAAWHFPRTETGAYAGYYPANGRQAVEQVEAWRARGGEFLVFPSTAGWWLDYYVELAQHLGSRYQRVECDEETCTVFDLRDGASAMAHGGNGFAADVSVVQNGNGSNGRGPIRDDGDGGARLIAFYLPQYHPCPENDAWWGKGFTEWTNVAQAKPLFAGHQQPRLPGELGFYDLRLPEVRQAQADLAAAHGIDGFCYWHYWFEGRRLLERPFDEVLASGEPRLPFCLSWANESWSRRWHGSGREEELLLEQTYSAADDREHARWLARALSDDRYMRIDGRPLFLIYRPADLPAPRRFLDCLREECAKVGLAEPYVVGANAHKRIDYRTLGLDATLGFEPQLGMLAGAFDPQLKIYDYAAARQKMKLERAYPTHPCVFVGWDNTPRRGEDGIVVLNSEPHLYEAALREAVVSTAGEPAEERLVFINAWNEWAEGNYLEPDLRYGRAYLEATKRVAMPRLTAAPR